MRVRIAIALLVSAVPLSLSSAAVSPQAPAWEETWGPAAFTEVRDLAIQDGRAFAAAGGGLFDLRAFDVTAGVPLWRVPATPASGAAEAVVVAGLRVFVGGSIVPTGRSDGDWTVGAFDVIDGEPLWVDTFDHRGLSDGVGALAISGGRLFAAGRVNSHLRFGGEYLVRAYDASDGRLLWQDMKSTGGDDSADQVIAEGDGVWVAGILAPRTRPQIFVRAYDAATGAVRWSRRVDPDFDGRPTGIAKLGGRILVAGELGGQWLVEAYDAESGRTLWRHTDNSAAQPTNVIGARGRFVVAGAGNGFGGFDLLTRAYDARTGDVVWEDRATVAGQSTHGRTLDRRGGTIAVAGTIYTPPAAGHAIRARGLDLRTGRLRWQIDYDLLDSDEEVSVIRLHRRRLLVGGLLRPFDSGASALLLGYDTGAR